MTERYQQTRLLDLKSGWCDEKKTEVNANIKAASKSISSKKFSLLKARTTREIKRGATFISKHGFEHAEKTEVILFIGLHAVQNYDKSIKSNIWPQKHDIITVTNCSHCDKDSDV